MLTNDRPCKTQGSATCSVVLSMAACLEQSLCTRGTVGLLLSCLPENLPLKAQVHACLDVREAQLLRQRRLPPAAAPLKVGAPDASAIGL